MPYSDISELPDAVKTRYSERCQRVFMRAFNAADGDEATRFKVAHTAAGNCREAGKAEPMKAQALDPDEMEAWFEGKLPRKLLAIPFGGPLPSRDGKGRDMDREFFDERTDIKADWFDERPIDWHHSLDPYGVMNGVLIGKAKDLEMEEDGWWVDAWLRHGEQRLSLVRKLAEKGGQLFGSSYAYPNLVKRDRKTGHIDVWPYMVQTLSTSPQNTLSVTRPAKATLDLFDEAGIPVAAVIRDLLPHLDVLRDLDPTSEGGDGPAKAGRELSGMNLAELEEWLETLRTVTGRAETLITRVREKYLQTG